jgi:hypothetical protein
MYGRSSARRRIGGSVARRRGIAVVSRLSTLPAGKPLPCTASTRMRVISCESVRCSAAARRRSDSFNSLGTYAPMKTPFRFAIITKNSPWIGLEKCPKQWSGPVSRILFPSLRAKAIIHLGRTLPNGSSDLPGNAASFSREH